MKNIQKKIFKKLNILISNSLGLVAALAWNSAFQNLFKKYPKLQENGPWVYALIVTIISVITITYLTQIEEKIDNIRFYNKSSLIFILLILGAIGFIYFLSKKNYLIDFDDNEIEISEKNIKNE